MHCTVYDKVVILGEYESSLDQVVRGDIYALDILFAACVAFGDG
jgi:hypothetical protein